MADLLLKVVEETCVVLFLNLEFALEINFQKQRKCDFFKSSCLAETGYQEEQVALLLEQ